MGTPTTLLCDGCGQLASPQHIAQRLQRLEWTTRYRPVHIKTLLLGACSPLANQEFLYAPDGAGSSSFAGEALYLFEAAGLSILGKTADALHSEFQRLGLFLTHVLECPLEPTHHDVQSTLPALLVKRSAAVATRIRRSLKPKRVLLFSRPLTPLVDIFSAERLGCSVITDGGAPFSFGETNNLDALDQLRKALATP
ncbi:MAG: hypothetical protein NVS9B4_04190 [Candidatus Acidiferrum sp.]